MPTKPSDTIANSEFEATCLAVTEYFVMASR
jgi:hypothetical protein